MSTKAQFLNVLKSTIGTLQSKNITLVLGFAACELYRLNFENSITSWSNSIIKVLKKTRCLKITKWARVSGKKPRKNVEPGKCVSTKEDDDSNRYKSSYEEIDGNMVQSPTENIVDILSQLHVYSLSNTTFELSSKLIYCIEI